MLQTKKGNQANVDQHGYNGRADKSAVIDSGKWPDVKEAAWRRKENEEANPKCPHDRNA